ncbi:hypothetical protein NDU88_005174 [Pleurodeles waltl]|uniref:Uncharacterized protein n=1 Tax=Pleurodeles waltl TaxID=8319 RepID=A0AAV7MYH4_PLEWA|nr:hypothetical protein NDU88_005174 [Pleurodeles waltl]
MSIWVLRPFSQIARLMSLVRMREGGCETLRNLYPHDRFVTLPDAMYWFGLGTGQFLHYAKFPATAWEISPSFPEASPGFPDPRGLAELGRWT